MTRSQTHAIFLLLGLSLVGLISTAKVAHALGDEQVASLSPTLSGTRFRYQKVVVHPSNHIEEKLETKHYRVRRLVFPSIGKNGQAGNVVTGLYYQSKLPGKKKLVIILPIWGSHTYPSRKMTRSLLKYSGGQMNVLRILGKDFLFDWEAMREATTEQSLFAVIERMVERVQTHVIDIRRTVDWAETQPDINAQQLGLIGFSMGAVVASLIVASEPRIRASTLVMGGASPHKMFASCFGRAKKTRDTIISRFGWTRETFEKKLEKPFAPIDPANYAGRVDPKGVIIFDAKYDTCIPRSGRDSLWDAMGQPQRVSLPNDHKMAFLAMTPLGLNKMRRRIYTFLEATLVSM
jgi:dienelactone hydrolase